MESGALLDDWERKTLFVMVGLVPTTHVFLGEGGVQDVGARHKGEHDGREATLPSDAPQPFLHQ